MNAWPCTDHQHVTDSAGRNVSRGCVHCGEGRVASRIKSMLGIKPTVPALTAKQVANAAEWAELNASEPAAVK